MKKLNHFFVTSSRLQRIVHWVTAILLFLIPSVLVPAGEYFIGGDDSRFYVAFPELWLRNVILSPISGFSIFVKMDPSLISGIPTELLLSLVKFLTPSFINFQFLMYGAIVSLCYVMTFNAINYELSRKSESDHAFWASYLATFVFVFANTVVWTIWLSHLKSIFLLVVFPFSFLLTSRYLDGKSSHLTMVFEVLILSLLGISLASFPFVIPFFLVTLLYFLPRMLSKVVLLRAFLLIITLLVINSYWMFPLAKSVKSSEFAYQEVSATNHYRTNLEYIYKNGAGHTAYTLLNVFNQSRTKNYQYENVKQIQSSSQLVLIAINGFWLAIVVLSVYLPREKVSSEQLWRIVLFLLLVLFSAGAIDSISFFVMQQSSGLIPFISLIRNFWHKMPITFSFYSAILFAFSLDTVIKHSYKRNILIFKGTLFIAAFSALLSLLLWIFLFTLNSSARTNVTDISQLERYVDYTSGSILTLPLSVGTWSVHSSSDTNSLYIGSPLFKLYFDKPTLGGIASFRAQSPALAKYISELSRQSDPETFQAILGLLQVHHVYIDKQAFEFAFQNREIVSNHLDVYLHLLDDNNLNLVWENDNSQLYEFSNKYLTDELFVTNNVFYTDKDSIQIALSQELPDACYKSFVVAPSGDQFLNPSECEREVEYSYEKLSRYEYVISVDVKTLADEILIQLNLPNTNKWKLETPSAVFVTERVEVNSFANGWIVDVSAVTESDSTLEFRVYYDDVVVDFSKILIE